MSTETDPTGLDLPPGAERHYLYRDGHGGEAWLFVDSTQVTVIMPAVPPAPTNPTPHILRLTTARLRELADETERIGAERRSSGDA